MNPIEIFKSWLEELDSTIGKNIPSSIQHQKIWSLVTKRFGAEIERYLGRGDNGLAFMTNDRYVVKFTIDRNEAILWNRIKNDEIEGIAQVEDIIRLSSSLAGDTHIYVIKVQYIAHELTNEQKQLVRNALNSSRGEPRSYRNKLEHVNDRAVRLVNSFEKIAEIDDSFSLIPDLIMDMADKYGGYIYDLQPNNFKINDNNKVVLIDPSIPDLVGDVKDSDKLFFENKNDEYLDLVLNSYILIV